MTLRENPLRYVNFHGADQLFRFWFLEAHCLTEVGPRIPGFQELEKEQPYCKCAHLVSKET